MGYITLRDNAKERFFSYGYQKEKSSLFFCSMKTELANIFSCTVFKKHLSYLLDQNQNQINSSGVFLYLPSTLDQKQDILKWKDNFYLHPVDLSINDLKEMTGHKEINPALLNDKNLRVKIVAGYYKLMKKIAEISN